MRAPLACRRAGSCAAPAGLCALAVALAACTRNPDADLWDCQFAVQKDNAGRSAADIAEREQSIAACMSERGYRLDSRNRACVTGSTTPQCYTK